MVHLVNMLALVLAFVTGVSSIQGGARSHHPAQAGRAARTVSEADPRLELLGYRREDRATRWQAAEEARDEAERQAADQAAQAAAQSSAARVAPAVQAAPKAPAPVQPAPAAPGPAASGAIPDIIRAAFSPLGQGAVDWALRVAKCESGYNPNAHNPAGYMGLFQFAPSTWAGTPYAGSSPYDGAANAKAAAWLYQRSGPSPWGCK